MEGEASVRWFILILGTILLVLLWTNPKSEDFEQWARGEGFEETVVEDAQHIYVRSKSYLFFFIP